MMFSGGYQFTTIGKRVTSILVSREIQFISYFIQESHGNLDNNDKFDRMGDCAVFVIFSYTWQKNPPHEYLSIRASYSFRIHNDDCEIKIDNLYQYNFENKKYLNDTLKKNARQCWFHYFLTHVEIE